MKKNSSDGNKSEFPEDGKLLAYVPKHIYSSFRYICMDTPRVVLFSGFIVFSNGISGVWRLSNDGHATLGFYWEDFTS